MALPPTFDARLVSARLLTKDVRELVFERLDQAPMNFAAGQWVSLVLPGKDATGGELRRSYSIASSPNASPRFEIAITRVQGGPGSSFLHELEIGSNLRVIGPQGFFVRPLEKAAPSLFIGTGTGVTPLRSMLKNAIERNETYPLWLLFGTRTPDDILYRDEFDALTKTHPNVRVLYTLSRASDGWNDRRGYVQEHVRELFDELAGLGLGAPHAYICGLQDMVGAVRDLLRKEMNLTREQVHSERYD